MNTVTTDGLLLRMLDGHQVLVIHTTAEQSQDALRLTVKRAKERHIPVQVRWANGNEEISLLSRGRLIFRLPGRVHAFSGGTDLIYAIGDFAQAACVSFEDAAAVNTRGGEVIYASS